MKNLGKFSKIIITFMIAFVMVSGFTRTTEAASNMPQIKIVDSKKLTYKMLSTRKGKNIIYIERVKGKVLNKKLDGKITNPRKGYGDYISYRRVKDVRKGDTVITYFVYNPDNNADDDVILRLDFIVNR